MPTSSKVTAACLILVGLAMLLGGLAGPGLVIALIGGAWFWEEGEG